MATSNIVKKRNKNPKISLLKNRLCQHLHHFLTVANPHGFVHLVRPKRSKFEKLFWIICIGFVAIPCVIVSRQAWHRYANSPTVTSLLRNYQQWRHTFPAVTMCATRIKADMWEDIYDFFDKHGYLVLRDNPKEDENFTTPATKQREVSMRAVRVFVRSLLFGNLSTYDNLEIFKDKFDELDPELYLELNTITHAIFSEDETKNWGRFSCDQTVTEFGVCYSFNSILANYSSPKRFKNRDMSLISHANIVDILSNEEEPFLHISAIPVEAKIFVHSYNEIPSYHDNAYPLKENSAIEMLLVTEKHQALPEVRNLRISQRHCRFTEESNLHYYPVYSLHLCRLECKMHLAMQFCGCMPYFYRRLYGEKVCNLDGMMCLAKHEYELTNLKDRNTKKSLCAPCEMKCEDEVITIVRNNRFYWMFNSQITVTLSLLTQSRLQISTIYTETDFLVQIGGLAGLAYGIGLLSVIEIVYFLTIRFYFAIFRGRIVKT